MGLQQFRHRCSRKDNDALRPPCTPLYYFSFSLCTRLGSFVFFREPRSISFLLLAVPCSAIHAHTPARVQGPSVRYAKSLNTAVKRRRRVRQYGERGCHAFLLVPFARYESRRTPMGKIEILTLTLHTEMFRRIPTAATVVVHRPSASSVRFPLTRGNWQNAFRLSCLIDGYSPREFSNLFARFVTIFL